MKTPESFISTKITTIVTTIVITIIGLILASCGDSFTENSTGSNKTVLESTWVGECTLFTDGQSEVGSILTDRYVNSIITSYIDLFSALDCSGLPALTKEMIGTFSIDTGNNINASRLDFQYNSATTTGSIAEIDPNTLGFETGTTFYTIFNIEGDNLYYGDLSTGDMTSQRTRPFEIDLNIVYTRQ